MRRLLLPALALALAACAPRAVQPAQHVYQATQADVIAAIRAACPQLPTDPFYAAWKLGTQQPDSQLCYSAPSLGLGTTGGEVQTLTFRVVAVESGSVVTVQGGGGVGQGPGAFVFGRLDASLPHR